MSLIYLSQNLRFLRKALHFSQWQVALWLNVERSSYTYYELGRTMPPLPVLLKLAWFFEVSLDGLVLTDLTKTPPEYLPACIQSPEPTAESEQEEKGTPKPRRGRKRKKHTAS